MTTKKLAVSVCLAALIAAGPLTAQTGAAGTIFAKNKHVLLISIDGMHALDFQNCIHGVEGVNGGSPYCTNLAQLAQSGVSYTQAFTQRPSDSMPGIVGLTTGGTTRSAGVFYDVSYDRSLSPPAQTTPYGIPGNPSYCPSIVGTQVGYDEEIDIDYTQLNAGGGINPNYLPRDPKNNCAPVYPHSFLRVNTMFEVVKSAGGYTAWSDKHQSYEIVNGPSGQGLNDYFAPEINSYPVALPTVPGCNPLPDQNAVGSGFAWTDSFQNIQCYDSLKVQAILNQIDGKTHDGSANAPVPNVFGMNFQAVSVGQKLVETSISVTGGYTDALGTPSAALLSEIQYVDKSIGLMVAELKARGLYSNTWIIVTAKHGQSPIDPNRVLRIPADNQSYMAPSDVLGGLGNGLPGGGLVGQALEDDVSLLWLTDPTQVANSVAKLEQNEAIDGGGEIFSGANLALFFNNPASDPRVPQIVVAPNVGVVYTGGKKKIAEHGGFANDDRNVMMLVSNSGISPATNTQTVATEQVAPTVLKILGLNPNSLQAVQQEGTDFLPGLFLLGN